MLLHILFHLNTATFQLLPMDKDDIIGPDNVQHLPAGE